MGAGRRVQFGRRCAASRRRDVSTKKSVTPTALCRVFGWRTQRSPFGFAQRGRTGLMSAAPPALGEDQDQRRVPWGAREGIVSATVRRDAWIVRKFENIS